MRIQIIQDAQGANAGIFIPMEDWNIIKINYPDIDSLDKNIPEWQKKIIDTRLDAIKKNPNLILPISELFNGLDSID